VGCFTFKFTDSDQKVFKLELVEALTTVCQAFSPRPVIYLTNRYKAGQTRDLDIFKQELSAISRVREKMGFKNLSLSVGQVRSVSEMENLIDLVKESGLTRSHSFKMCFSVETPANVILIESYSALEIDCVSINLKKLTELTLGARTTELDNFNMPSEEDKAIQLSLSHLVGSSLQHGLSVSVQSDLLLNSLETIQLLVREGATSVTVLPESVVAVRNLIASVEKRVL
jgi:pyruvate,water dikinase